MTRLLTDRSTGFIIAGFKDVTRQTRRERGHRKKRHVTLNKLLCELNYEYRRSN